MKNTNYAIYELRDIRITRYWLYCNHQETCWKQLKFYQTGSFTIFRKNPPKINDFSPKIYAKYPPAGPKLPIFGRFLGKTPQPLEWGKSNPHVKIPPGKYGTPTPRKWNCLPGGHRTKLWNPIPIWDIYIYPKNAIF